MSVAAIAANAEVGVIGLGQMGRGIAETLAKQGGAAVCVWDVNQDARAPFTGRDGFAVVPPADMAARCDAILLVVPGTAEIEACLEGPDGIRAAAPAGLVLCDLTTSDPDDTRAVAARLAGDGIAYIDAGMSGGAAGAQAGTLTLMAGGDKEAFARLRPTLDVIADKIHYLGDSGAGHTMKLLHNVICHANFLAASEVLRAGESAGLELADMIGVINDSNGRSYITETRFPRDILSGTWSGRSRVFNLHKDLTMGLALARRLGSGTRFAQATLAYLEAALARGMADADFTLLYRHLDRLRETAPPPDEPGTHG